MCINHKFVMSAMYYAMSYGISSLQPVWHTGDAIPDDHPRNQLLILEATNE